MPYRNLYLSKEEEDFIKTQPEGWVRSLVQKAMGRGGLDLDPAPKLEKIKEVIKKLPNTQVGVKGDGLHTCKKCGSQLMYYKAKCKCG